ncbi:MAG TPA: aromatic ring-hydroxylating dioxygenase subunit alpha [Steroidobacteraceae bacterium]|nr:aromatic ring-hydroxylating dioxygenase subunit alpha [Steroidobacteraceae bacterium]
MFLKNCWYVAAWDYELIDGKLLARTLLNEHVLLYRGDSGEVTALNNRCPHRGALLSEGRREGDSVRCMYHGLKYDHTGKCVQIPGQDMIPPKLRVRKYPIVESGHLVWIWMGDPARADRALIPEFAPLHDPKWKGLPAYLHYDSNYLLIVDNLSDFAHLAFVHTHTLGGSEEYAYVTKPVVIEKQERGFRVERWHMNSEAPPFHKKVIRDKDARVDRRNHVTMLIPGIFYMETTFAPAGQGAEKGIAVPGTREYRNCQYMTPETERTTHFFWNYLNNFEGDDSNISRSLLDSLIEGFMEDKAIIEQQQKTLDEDPGFQMLGILSDAPLAHFRRVLSKLIEAEQAADKAPPAGAVAAPRATSLA